MWLQVLNLIKDCLGIAINLVLHPRLLQTILNNIFIAIIQLNSLFVIYDLSTI